jgi:RNA polymerase sigma-70 factor (ECF subfamily)
MRSSFRTWLYTLARHAAARRLRSEGKRRREAPLSVVAGLPEAMAEVRTTTALYLRSAVRDRLTELRRALPEADQALLILRVDRGLEWNELAQVMAGEVELGREDRAREAARLRKRFQLIKERLREQARREGLLARED